ncbi:MAG: endonuclease III [Limosilactobacillus sp.]|uniref:endonuclease III n=1 Tax=Limosilactobacillus sp. TaxID=2773925 RepID=UPI0026FB948E|nr:endonuclease III [Limosilactobacillus sp.]
MLSNEKIYEAVKVMRREYPEAGTTLDGDSNFHFLLAVILSAQSTDQSVNQLTPMLFERFKTPEELAAAEPEDVEPYIQRLGLFRNKAKYLVNCARKLVTDFDSTVPSTIKELTSLPGVGRKVANVVQAECFGIPAFPVDTHVTRVARRLAMVPPKASVLAIEKKMREAVPEEKWLDAHHSMIFWGRYRCMAKNPHCNDCPLLPICITGQQLIKK